jgi:hypothetical protein
MGTRTGARFLPREVDRAGAQLATTQARDHGLDLDRASARIIVESLGAGAPGVLPALFRLEALLPRLASELDRNQFVEAPSPAVRCPLDADADAVKSSLRAARDEALVRTALRELDAAVDVDGTAREWSHVAAMTTEHALAAAAAMVEARNGPPLDARGARCGLTVLGMGKLGGEELNLGSDIDICLFYATDDGAAGTRTLNQHFGRVGTTLADLLGDVTADGFAFRVDLRLRPEGSRGPVANALASAERYYETWGRTWERAALLRARPIAGDLALGRSLLDALRPFVFRRAVDPTVAGELRGHAGALAARAAPRRRARPQARARGHPGGGVFRSGAAAPVGRAAPGAAGGGHAVGPGAAARARALVAPRAARPRRGLGPPAPGGAPHPGDAALRDAHAPDRRAAPRRARALARIRRRRGPARRARRSPRPRARPVGHPHAGPRRAGRWPRARRRSSSPEAPSVFLQLAEAVSSGLDAPALSLRAVDALGVRDGDAAAADLARLARRADQPLGADGLCGCPYGGRAPAGRGARRARPRHGPRARR